MSATRTRVREDGRTVYFFGSAPGIDPRTSVVVVTGDNEDVARGVSGSLAGRGHG